MVIKTHEDFKRINLKNIKMFNRYHTSESDKCRYRCVICGNKTSIDGSFSNRGSKLVCCRCAYNRDLFNGYSALNDWLGADDDWTEK